MERRSIAGYIWVGTALRFLQDTPAGSDVHGVGWLLENAESLRRWLEFMKMPVSVRAFDAIVGPIYTELKAMPVGHQTTAAESDRVRKAGRELRTVIDAEAAGSVMYVAIDRRYASEKLLDNVAVLLAPGTFAVLGDVARSDMQEAGRCIAFGLPTAAAFHVLRATEETLRGMYRRYVKRGAPALLLWGPMIVHLRKRKKRPPDVLLNHLWNIKDSFRNPTDHPEKIYEIEEAQDLFAVCLDVINRMVKQVP